MYYPFYYEFRGCNPTVAGIELITMKVGFNKLEDIFTPPMFQKKHLTRYKLDPRFKDLLVAENLFAGRTHVVEQS